MVLAILCVVSTAKRYFPAEWNVHQGFSFFLLQSYYHINVSGSGKMCSGIKLSSRLRGKKGRNVLPFLLFSQAKDL